MKIVSKKIRASARGEDCLVRIPGVCNFNPETTIAAHVGKSGMGIKPNDTEIAYCCSNCHDAIDGRVIKTMFTNTELKLMAHEGAARTRAILCEKGLLKVL